MIKVSSGQIIFGDLPMPPSENNAYATFRGRRIPSRDNKAFKDQMRLWHFAHAGMVTESKRIVAGWAAPMQLRILLGFHHGRAWTKDGRVKRKDAANYVKLLQDGLATALEIDDSVLWGTSVEKAPMAPESTSPEACIAVLTPAHPKLWREWKDHLGIV